MAARRSRFEDRRRLASTNVQSSSTRRITQRRCLMRTLPVYDERDLGCSRKCQVYENKEDENPKKPAMKACLMLGLGAECPDQGSAEDGSFRPQGLSTSFADHDVTSVHTIRNTNRAAG